MRVLVDKAVELCGADGVGGDDFAMDEGFAGIIDDAGLEQLAQSVAEYLGVDAEVAVGREGVGEGGSEWADAALEGIAIIDQLGGVLADADEGVVGRKGWGREFGEWLRVGDGEVDGGLMEP